MQVRRLRLSDIHARNRLLEFAFKDVRIDIPIGRDYPLVLGSDHCEFSYGVFDEKGVLCSHGNLWPRQVTQHGGPMTIGLVGNIATRQAMRGQGLIRKLLNFFKDEAIQHHMSALVLWSDLIDFYAKHEFFKFGREKRLFFDFDNFKHSRLGDVVEAKCIDNLPVQLDQETRQFLLSNRFKVKYTLERSITEFSTLLTIPYLKMLRFRHNDGEAFGFMNRGSDLSNVIFEWGASDARSLLKIVQAGLELCSPNPLILLAPDHLEQILGPEVTDFCYAIEDHSMALCWKNPEGIWNRDFDNELFIWGFDSI